MRRSHNNNIDDGALQSDGTNINPKSNGSI